jgi:hypothetical protein
MVHSIRSWLVGIPSACAVAAIAFACGGTTANEGDGGSAPGPGATGFCSVLSSYSQRCGVQNACEQAEVRDCAMIVPAYSDAYLNGGVACQSQLTCVEAGTTQAFSMCLQSYIASAPRSAAQTKLAADYCAVCANGMTAAACESSFWTANSLGAIVGVFGDAIIGQIDAQCTGAALMQDSGRLGGCNEILFCASMVAVGQAYAPPECKADGG